MLRVRRKDQRREREAASDWEHNDLVFCHPTPGPRRVPPGRWWYPDHVSHAITGLIAISGLPRIRPLQDLRHAHALARVVVGLLTGYFNAPAWLSTTPAQVHREFIAAMGTLAYGLLPRVYPGLLALLYYRAEVILRETAILGMLGVATLGLYIEEGFDYLMFDVAFFLLLITAALNIAVALAEMAWEAGCSVVTVSATLHPEFMAQAASGTLPAERALTPEAGRLDPRTQPAE